MSSRFFSLYELLILRRPLLSLLVTIGVVVFLATYIPSFKLDASADALVLEGDDSLKYFREISKRYASEDFLLITYRPEKDLFSEDSLSVLSDMQREFSSLEGVSSVVTILDVPLLESPKVTLEEVASAEGIRTLRSPGIDKELVRAELANSPVYKNLLTSADGQTTAVQINLQRDEKYHALLANREILREKALTTELTKIEQADLAAAEKVFDDYVSVFNDQQNQLVEVVRAKLDKYRKGATVFLGGVPMIAADMIGFVKSDLVVFGSGIIAFIIITLSFIFRRVTWVLLPLFTCVLSATFMLGLITFLDWRMTVISSNFVALLLIITLSVTIHLVVRYRELLSMHPEMDQKQIVTQAARLMIKPCVYTTLTTIVAFASLVFSGIRPVIDFGWMMTVGVMSSLVIAFIILPASLLLVKKPAMSATGTSSVAMTLRFAGITEGYGRAILFIAVVLVVLSGWGISQLKVENRFIDYFHESTEIYQGMEVIDEQLGGTIPLDIIIDAEKEELVESSVDRVSQADTGGADVFFDDEFDDAFGDDFADDFADDFSGGQEDSQASYWFNRAGLTRIEAVHDYMDTLDETGKVLSLATSYKLLRNLTAGVDDIQLALIQRSLPPEISSVLVDPYLKEDIDQTRITVRVMETSRSLQRDELLKTVKSHLVNEMGFKEDQVHLTGMLVLYNNMLQSLYRSQILTIGTVFFAIMIMFMVLFRSLKISLIAIAPNILAAGVVVGGMGLVGIPLDIMTVTIAAISVGIGVDNTIHYVHRFRTEFIKDKNYMATMYRCHGSIGKAMYYTSSTIIVGFSILALSNFNPSIYFGLLTGTAMFAALMGALLLLPTLLITLKPLGPEEN